MPNANLEPSMAHIDTPHYQLATKQDLVRHAIKHGSYRYTSLSIRLTINQSTKHGSYRTRPYDTSFCGPVVLRLIAKLQEQQHTHTSTSKVTIQVQTTQRNAMAKGLGNLLTTKLREGYYGGV